MSLMAQMRVPTSFRNAGVRRRSGRRPLGVSISHFDPKPDSAPFFLSNNRMFRERTKQPLPFATQKKKKPAKRPLGENIKMPGAPGRKKTANVSEPCQGSGNPPSHNASRETNS